MNGYSFFSLKFYPVFLLFSLFALQGIFAQFANNLVKAPVDEADYQRILEYYTYDPGIPSDPRSYGEWPWRGWTAYFV